MKKVKKVFMVLLCAITVASTIEARGGRGGGRGGMRGGRGGFHRGGGRGRWHGHGGHGWGHRGYGHRGYWGGGFWGGYRRPWWGVGFAPTVVVGDDSTSYAPQRPSSLDTFISEFGRNPRGVNEFCNWVNQTGRSQRQCDLYRAYRGY